MKKLTLFIFLFYTINLVFSQDKQTMGGCEHFLGSPGIFTCSLCDPDGISCEQTIYLCQPDTLRLCEGSNCVPDGTSSAFQWKNHGVNIIGATTSCYTIVDTGLYSLSFFNDGSPCGGNLTMGNIHVLCTASGINEHANPTFHLFPNPANEELTVDLDNYENATITFYNTLGQNVLTTKLNSKTSKVDISSLDNVYIISVDNKNGTARQKMIKNAH